MDAVTPNWTAAGLEVLEENRRTRSAEDPLPFSRRRPVVPSTKRSVTILRYRFTDLTRHVLCINVLYTMPPLLHVIIAQYSIYILNIETLYMLPTAVCKT